MLLTNFLKNTVTLLRFKATGFFGESPVPDKFFFFACKFNVNWRKQMLKTFSRVTHFALISWEVKMDIMFKEEEEWEETEDEEWEEEEW